MTPSLTDLALLIPELILVSMALALLLGASRIRNASMVTTATVIAAVVAAVVAALIAGRLSPDSPSLVGFSGMIIVDGYSQFFKILIAAALAARARGLFISPSRFAHAAISVKTESRIAAEAAVIT